MIEVHIKCNIPLCQKSSSRGDIEGAKAQLIPTIIQMKNHGIFPIQIVGYVPPFCYKTLQLGVTKRSPVICGKSTLGKTSLCCLEYKIKCKKFI